MESYRMVYVLLEGTDYDTWVVDFWNGRLPEENPLRQLLTPEELGEVRGWGERTHITLCDALTTNAPEEFDQVVRKCCVALPPPEVDLRDLKVFKGIALVVRIQSPELGRLRAKLQENTHPYIVRYPITDEEWQRAMWWIREKGGELKKNLEVLETARKIYESTGSPVLPSSRHFRMNFLIGYLRKLNEARDSATSDRVKKALDHFFKFGEPPWYRKSGGLHTTIASGLDPKRNRLELFNQKLWPEVRRRLSGFRPKHLAIMGEDMQHKVPVRFWDALTETFVDEERPGFKVIERVSFSC